MASIERTAYPRFSHPLSDRELDARYGPTDEETTTTLAESLGASARLTFLVMLKTRQQLGYFPLLDEVPEQIVTYHHISATYIALFSKFIACGVWEAVYILDALLEQRSEMEPDIIHADTQGQSEPVFGLAHLLGIKLFPRMRNWNDVIFYRPEKGRAYRHIDALFSKSIDWALIETHWQDMMQVVLSIQAGKILPSTLLRKLGSHSRQNKLNRAFRELGRAMRTLFLLRYISEADLRRSIRAETTKVESYNDFLDWIGFGGPVLKSDDPVEQAKQVKYMDLVANVIMLHNVHDLTEILADMEAEGWRLTRELLAGLSPYLRDHIRRFGRYLLDMEDMPPPLALLTLRIRAENPD